MDIFAECQEVNDLLDDGQEGPARRELIRLLDKLHRLQLDHDPVVNHLVRVLGLYPYMSNTNCGWEDYLVKELFRQDVGGNESVVLHREQSRLLSRLYNGDSVAVSAPTSFGKSFVIDSFISLRNPSNVVIIVPTIALTDETRRRLTAKFKSNYKIITTPEEDLEDRNILIFPQERAIGYVEAIESIDLLVIDEFYKASKEYDKERAPSLIHAIVALASKARQRYYLAPNISSLEMNDLTNGMEFLRLDFHTVALEVHDEFKKIGPDSRLKEDSLLSVVGGGEKKTLVYAGTYSGVSEVSTLFLAEQPVRVKSLLREFSDWLAENYSEAWNLTKLVQRGVGIHTGQLHRSLSQIQIRLFELDDGIHTLVSTSSIIEGVNTSAEQVVVWSNKIGRSLFNDFTYRNIIGRGGRMFKHFVGQIYVLEKPPAPDESQLSLEIMDEIVDRVDDADSRISLTPEQIAKLHQYHEDMDGLLGSSAYSELRTAEEFETSDMDLTLKITKELRNNSEEWNGLRNLNSDDPSRWTRLLWKFIKLNPGAWQTAHGKFIQAIKVMAGNWNRSIPEQLQELSNHDISIDEYFKIERVVSFKLAAIINDVVLIYNYMYRDKAVEVKPFLVKVSHAFLPRLVYQLEEYGLPRSISKKLHHSGIVDLTSTTQSIHDVIGRLNEFDLQELLTECSSLSAFDVFVLEYFYEGI